MLVGGLGIAGFTTMQGTLPFVIAPPEIRGRIMGLLSVCIGVGPLGYLHLGFLAQWLGASLATTLVAIEALAAMALAAAFLLRRPPTPRVAGRRP
jgi:drug/metabolite transporter (DMT)-like permease